jgi:hypothetical protein
MRFSNSGLSRISTAVILPTAAAKVTLPLASPGIRKGTRQQERDGALYSGPLQKVTPLSKKLRLDSKGLTPSNAPNRLQSFADPRYAGFGGWFWRIKGAKHVVSKTQKNQNLGETERD